MLRNSSDGVWGERKKYRLSLTTATPDEVENLLIEKFVGGFPVVLSSGRGAIKLIVQEFWPAKDISIFQYASQCVVEAIQAAAVTPYSRINFSSEIIYNQWGELDLGCQVTPFMEDSCDTFLPEGSSVLKHGAQFEIWSLPKILHSRFGAIAWCRNSEDAMSLRKIRDNSKKGNVKKQILRNFRNSSKWNYTSWQESEFKTYMLSKYEYGSLLKDISEWGKLYDERQKLIEKYSIFLNQRYSEFLKSWKNNESGNRIQLSPVLLLELNGQCPPGLLGDTKYQVMHKIQTGKRPQKVSIYKLLQKGNLK